MEDVDAVIFLNITKNLSDDELAKFCRTNRKFKAFCSERNTLLWQQRFIKSLGKYYEKFNEGSVLDVINKYRQGKNLSWMRYYFYVISELHKHFILLSADDPPDDIVKLIEIMNKEPFNLINDDMYENTRNINDQVYMNLSEQEKRWVSPDALLYQIIKGNITNPDIINIVLSYDFPIETIDTIGNSIQDDVNINGLSIAIAILEKILNGDLTPEDRGYVREDQRS